VFAIQDVIILVFPEFRFSSIYFAFGNSKTSFPAYLLYVGQIACQVVAEELLEYFFSLKMEL
jgi:hypothetical protein